MKTLSSFILITLVLTTALQIRLFHDNKKGYSYNITGSSIDEIIESDQKMRQYLKSLIPSKKAGPAPSASAPKPASGKK
jgi:hypothetical protein